MTFRARLRMAYRRIRAEAVCPGEARFVTVAYHAHWREGFLRWLEIRNPAAALKWRSYAFFDAVYRSRRREKIILIGHSMGARWR